jgi:hypothetical protein
MNATKTITSFAIAAIALSAAVFNAPMADAKASVKAPVKIAQADTKTESTKTEAKSTSCKKGSKGAKKHVKTVKTEAKSETKEAAPAAAK